ncbi:MAG: hypothetical protein NC218_11620 [Acetobacter sp.]|nr:hypothetical protein [Acetobacter sp.]
MVLFLLMCHRSERSEVKRSRKSMTPAIRAIYQILTLLLQNLFYSMRVGRDIVRAIEGSRILIPCFVRELVVIY